MVREVVIKQPLANISPAIMSSGDFIPVNFQLPQPHLNIPVRNYHIVKLCRILGIILCIIASFDILYNYMNLSMILLTIVGMYIDYALFSTCHILVYRMIPLFYRNNFCLYDIAGICSNYNPSVPLLTFMFGIEYGIIKVVEAHIERRR